MGASFGVRARFGFELYLVLNIRTSFRLYYGYNYRYYYVGVKAWG